MAKRILVVEDNDLNRKLFCDVLKSQGYAVEPCADGLEALDKARQFVPNLIIMDIQLPNVSGLDLIEAAKKDRGEIEETALGAMEEIDAAQAKLKQLEAELLSRKKIAQTAKANFEAAKPDVDAKIEAIKSQIAESEKVIPGEGKAGWDRLRKAHGASALAVMEDGFCEACSTKVTNQDMVRIRMSDFMGCRGCGRILYFSE